MDITYAQHWRQPGRGDNNESSNKMNRAKVAMFLFFTFTLQTEIKLLYTHKTVNSTSFYHELTAKIHLKQKSSRKMSWVSPLTRLFINKWRVRTSEGRGQNRVGFLKTFTFYKIIRDFINEACDVSVLVSAWGSSPNRPTLIIFLIFSIG